MKSKQDKNIENLVENMMKETSLESPSFDFISKVMSEVLAPEKKKSILYKPVISKGVWFILFAGIGTLITWIILNDYPEKGSSINFDFSVFNFEKIFKGFTEFQFSSITTNIIMVAVIMIFIQIILLKTHLNKRFQK